MGRGRAGRGGGNREGRECPRTLPVSRLPCREPPFLGPGPLFRLRHARFRAAEFPRAPERNYVSPKPTSAWQSQPLKVKTRTLPGGWTRLTIGPCKVRKTQREHGPTACAGPSPAARQGVKRSPHHWAESLLSSLSHGGRPHPLSAQYPFPLLLTNGASSTSGQVTCLAKRTHLSDSREARCGYLVLLASKTEAEICWSFWENFYFLETSTLLASPVVSSSSEHKSDARSCGSRSVIWGMKSNVGGGRAETRKELGSLLASRGQCPSAPVGSLD